ncbi:LysE family translocator [Planktotalea sp.]|uniref:LysE family translocator n=1 Tax=Planktotalea sp. TaxID=2029877 RepID=UPI003D6BE1B3
MVDPLVLLAFIPAALLLNLTPGADMMFCLGQGLRSGKLHAIAASAGITLGGMVHVVLAGLGLSTAIAALPFALETIRWIGVAYLLWLAWSSWSAHSPKVSRRGTPELSAWQAFWQGFIVNMSNPKIILFVLAFVPQFVDPARGSVLAQFALFGAVIGLGGFVINAAVGVLSGVFSQRVGQGGRGARILSRLSAMVFVGLALKLVWFEKGTQ